jgi:hypothetical protein
LRRCAAWSCAEGTSRCHGHFLLRLFLLLLWI